MPTRPTAPPPINYTELHQQDWQQAREAVQHWLVCRAGDDAAALAVAREQAAAAVYCAMLHDAVGIITNKADSYKPIAERRAALPMAHSLIKSIFSHHSFTVIIQSHDQAEEVNLRTWLTKRIHWKLGDRFRRESKQKKFLQELDLPLDADEYARLEQAMIPIDDANDSSTADPSADDYLIKQGWQRFEAVLTQREQQVMLCFFDGISNDDGCQRLGIKLAKYKEHKANALEKLRIMPDAT
jgi:DNA-directed RNA polymerase specialized sigma24 family protein